MLRYIKVFFILNAGNSPKFIFYIKKYYMYIMDRADAINYILQNNIEGVLVECGVQEGKTELIWIQELLKNNVTDKDIYLYDTFGGLVKPSKYDYTCTTSPFQMDNNTVMKTWENNKINDNVNNWCYCPLDIVKNNLNKTGYPQDRLHYIVGDVMQTLQDKSNIPEKIAVLRLDTDWYESSKYELEQMFDNVVTGGVVIFDDYYLWNGQKKAVDDYFDGSYSIIPVDRQTGAIIKR